ncbi:MAG: hypothetical protein C4518_10970 [Desulfobacteraceae bacterium]|nr:MAG: hypothetical protein C4518_10970 [Desulfobacteraceae bacterium]
MNERNTDYNPSEKLTRSSVASGIFCPLRCGPDPMVSVEYGGKLFERLKTNKPLGFDRHFRNIALRHSNFVSEFLPTPRKPEASGGFPQRTGRVSFATFLFPQKKSRGKKVD